MAAPENLHTEVLDELDGAAGLVSGGVAGRAALGVMCLGTWSWRPWLEQSEPWKLAAEGLSVQMVVVAAVSLVGWLFWLVPVAIGYALDVDRWSTRRLVVWGTGLGGGITVVACVLLLHGAQHAVSLCIPYVVTGVLIGASATAVCVVGIRRASVL